MSISDEWVDESVRCTARLSEGRLDFRVSDATVSVHRVFADEVGTRWSKHGLCDRKWSDSRVARSVLSLYDVLRSTLKKLSGSLEVHAFLCRRKCFRQRAAPVALDVFSWTFVNGTTGWRVQGVQADSFDPSVICRRIRRSLELPSSGRVNFAGRTIVLEGTAASVLLHEMLVHGSEWSGWVRGAKSWDLDFHAVSLCPSGRVTDDTGRCVRPVRFVEEGKLIHRPDDIDVAQYWAAPHELAPYPRFPSVSVHPRNLVPWPREFIQVSEVGHAEFCSGMISISIPYGVGLTAGKRVGLTTPMKLLLHADSVISCDFLPGDYSLMPGVCVRNGAMLPCWTTSGAIRIELDFDLGDLRSGPWRV